MTEAAITIDDSHAIAKLASLGPGVRQRLDESFRTVADSIASDAKSRAQAHIRYLGAKNPGSYVESIKGGVSDKASRVTGYVRSGHPLAHLMELGFTISDMMISANAAAVMAFDGGAGTVFARVVHRHETSVPPYPAIGPAFDDARGRIEAALRSAVADAAGAAR